MIDETFDSGSRETFRGKEVKILVIERLQDKTPKVETVKLSDVNYTFAVKFTQV